MVIRHGKQFIFMMDLWATVPYYTAYLSKALLGAGEDVMIGSISYYLDLGCFSSRNLRLEPGLFDVVSRLHVRPGLRRAFKLLEALLNMAALTIRFAFWPPAVVHVQYLPLLRWKIPIERWFLRFCRFRGARIVLTVHDILPHDTAQRYKTLFAAFYSSVDLLICHSASIRTRLHNEFAIPIDRIYVIPHGPFFYDLPAAGQEQTLQDFGVHQNKILVLWQGIIFPYKGLDLLLQAWQQVEVSGGDNICLIIAGTGAPHLLEEIREQIQQHHLLHVKLHLRFISSEELVALYRAADVVVYPYRAVTTSGALATGLALGKPIVATDLPVFREVLTDRKDALLFSVGNSSELAGALTELIQNPALRNQLAAKICEMNFGDQSWLSIARDTIAAYKHVLSSANHTVGL